jgi:hypothetical protein
MGYKYAQDAGEPRANDYASDACSKPGAEALAETIRAYWRARGFTPQVIVQEMPIVASKRSTAWVVRSTMRGGWPKDSTLKAIVS